MVRFCDATEAFREAEGDCGSFLIEVLSALPMSAAGTPAAELGLEVNMLVGLTVCVSAGWIAMLSEMTFSFFLKRLRERGVR